MIWWIWMFERCLFHYIYQVDLSMLVASVTDNGDTVFMLSQNNFGASEIQWLESRASFLFFLSLKVHHVIVGKKCQKRKIHIGWFSFFFFLPKQTVYTVSHCLYVAVPATFLASNSVLRTACLFTYGNNIYFWVCTITALIVSILHFWVWISCGTVPF